MLYLFCSRLLGLESKIVDFMQQQAHRCKVKHIVYIDSVISGQDNALRNMKERSMVNFQWFKSALFFLILGVMEDATLGCLIHKPGADCSPYLWNQRKAKR